MLSAQKAAAVMASTAALAGGAVATERVSKHDSGRRPVAAHSRAHGGAQASVDEQAPASAGTPPAIPEPVIDRSAPTQAIAERATGSAGEFTPEATQPEPSAAPAVTEAAGFETGSAGRARVARSAGGAAAPRTPSGQGRSGGEFGP
jgi:hypothetical protein